MSKPIVGAVGTGSRDPNPTDKNAEVVQKATLAKAQAAGAAVAGSDPKGGKTAYFVTVRETPERFDIYMGDTVIRGSMDRERKRVVFRVPTELVERFCRHSLVVSGAIVAVE